MTQFSWIKKRYRALNTNVLVSSRRRVKLLVFVTAVLIVGVIAGGIYITGDNFEGIERDESSPLPSASPDNELVYHALEGACDGIDFHLYKDAVGMKPAIEDETTTQKSSYTRSACWLRADDDAGLGFRLHNLGIVADVHQSNGDAKADYKNLLLSSGQDESTVKDVDGPWDQGVVYDVKDIDQGYAMDLVDNNVAVRFTQYIAPIDAISRDDAEQLMSALAKKLLSSMQA